MRRLHDYLDYYIIRAVCTDGTVFDGRPINVDYADENESGEDEIAIETDSGRIYGLKESEIARIEIVKE